MEEVWRLTRDGETIAELEVYGGDFPWLNARLRPTAAFERVRPLFEEELRCLEDMTGDDDAAADAFDEANARIREAVSLWHPDGTAVPDFLLHIDGDEAWWRW